MREQAARCPPKDLIEAGTSVRLRGHSQGVAKEGVDAPFSSDSRSLPPLPSRPTGFAGKVYGDGLRYIMPYIATYFLLP